MTCSGIVKGGVVVLDPKANLAEGTQVTVQTLDPALPADKQTGGEPTFADVISEFAGTMAGDDLPKDGAKNHDQYIYGAPKP